jgi:hypothetical protein
MPARDTYDVRLPVVYVRAVRALKAGEASELSRTITLARFAHEVYSMPTLVVLVVVALIGWHQLSRVIPPKYHKLDWLARKHGFPTYAAYLQSPHWQKMKRIIHRAYDERCNVCDAGPKTKKIVHHRSYDRFGREAESDLVLLCDDCHQRTHVLARRGAGLYWADRLLKRPYLAPWYAVRRFVPIA